MDGSIPTSRPKFDNPPVIEVMATVQFSELNKLKFMTYIKEIWNCFSEEEYPIIEYKNSFPSLTNKTENLHFSMSDGDKFDFTPRIWFESKDRQYVIQLQNDRLSLSWRMVDIHAKSTYSKYELIWERFFKLLSSFSDFANNRCSSKLELNFLELKYINLIPFSDFGGVNKIEDCIPSISLSKTPKYLGKPSTVNFSWTSAIDISSSNFKIQGVTIADKNSGDPLLRLDLIQSGKSDIIFDKDSKKIHNWYEDAHLRIINAFKDITSSTLHSDKWKIK